ncbi:SPASM domain-containing protein [Candidatus Hakubella thermalkaliphila]|uniref:SPASM domain-containing protein n=1 Tax=Candidatus Hakubella thermalkaliphila TaxID=2754717 RepID=UPI0015937FBE|nr:SPASM domain-containing protein [Candidatus Hakubella thermalkaliphila]
MPRKEQYSYYRTDGHEKQILNTSSSCSWLYRTAVINWDGGVSPCCSFHMTGYPENDFGNIQKESFKDIWNNELYRNSRRLVAGRIQGQEGDGQGQEIKSPCDACDMIVFRKKEKIR